MATLARSSARRVADLIPITTPNDPDGWFVGTGGHLAHRPSTVHGGRWRTVPEHPDNFGYQALCNLWLTPTPAPAEMTRCPDCAQAC